MGEEVVVDASALVDLLLRSSLGEAVERRLAGQALHGPAHIDAEALSALSRLERAGSVGGDAVAELLGHLEGAPIERHPVHPLLKGAWSRRANLRVADGLYVELAASLGMPLVTTDARLRSVPGVELVEDGDSVS